MAKIEIKFDGGWSTHEETGIKNNQVSIAQNASFDSSFRLGVRPGQGNFGDEIAGVDGVKNVYSTRLSDGTKILLAFAGTSMYRYNTGTGAWAAIKTGLTAGTKFSFLTYKDIISWTNGVDNFMDYDGTTVTEKPDVPKGKYMVLESDVAYMGGIETDPSLVVFTDANPTSLSADGFQNDISINEDEGYITGMGILGRFPVIGKSKGTGIYLLNVGTDPISLEPLDFDGDVVSPYAISNVENDMIFVSSRGVYSLAQRKGGEGIYRAYPWNGDIDAAFKRLGDKSLAASIYFRPTNNVYFCFDSGSGRNDTTFVYSVFASIPGQYQYKWTEYKNWAFNDFAVWEDDDGVSHLLAAPAYGGQIVEVEKKGTYSDNGLGINFRVKSKTFDLDASGTLKIWENLEITLLITQGEQATIVINADGVESSHVVDGSNFAVGDSAEYQALGDAPLSEYALGGGSINIDGINYYVASVRIPVVKYARRFSMQVETNSLNSAIKIIKATVDVVAMDESLIPASSYST